MKLVKRRGNLLIRAEWHTKKARKPHLLHLEELPGERTFKCVEIEEGGNKSKCDQRDSP